MSMWTAIVLIVFIGVAGGVASDLAKARSRRAKLSEQDHVDRGELENLRSRIEVLEKIVTDEGFDLRREIDRLERTG